MVANRAAICIVAVQGTNVLTSLMCAYLLGTTGAWQVVARAQHVECCECWSSNSCSTFLAPLCNPLPVDCCCHTIILA